MILRTQAQLLQELDEELEISTQVGYNSSLVTVINVPDALGGSGRKKLKNCDKFLNYVVISF